MSSDITEQRRVAIYAHWSASPKLTQNSIQYLLSLKKIATSVICVSNSKICQEQLFLLDQYGIDVVLRDNSGFDFGAWKEIILAHANKIKKADGLILCNSSCFLVHDGFESIIDLMDETSDIWGLTAYEDQETSYHLQSYFLLFRKNVLDTWDIFVSFWKNLPKISSWSSAVLSGEISLTSFFRKHNYRCTALFKEFPFDASNINPSIFCANELLLQGSPLLKKKLFTENYDLFLKNGRAMEAAFAMETVKKIDGGFYQEILQELIEITEPSQLLRSLHLTFVTNDAVFTSPDKRTKVAAICHVHYEDQINQISAILRRFLDVADIFLVSSDARLLKSYEKKIKECGVNINCRLQKNRGRNEAAYFVTCKDVWSLYKIVCVLHDKKSSHIKPPIQGKEFFEHCEINLFSSKENISQIINLFEINPLLGLLIPPPPFFGNLIPSVLSPLGRNKKSLQEVNEFLFQGDLFPSVNKVDVSSSPFGSIFWARSSALNPLLTSDLSFDFFPKEPINDSDGTILHALERVYPLIVKKSGFFTGRLINVRYVPVTLDNYGFWILELSSKEKIKFLLKKIIKEKFSTSPFLFSLIKKIYSLFRKY